MRGCDTGGGCNGGGNYAFDVSPNGFLSVNTGESIAGPGGFNYTAQLNAGTPPATWQKVDCLAQRAGPGAGGSYNHATVLATFGSKISVQNATMDLCQTTVYAGSNRGGQPDQWKSRRGDDDLLPAAGHLRRQLQREPPLPGVRTIPTTSRDSS